ncbi:MAG: hypothetical protein HY897_01360 [Deltaproteobacteria bacterium]|nr:hypothetical protein [Deltaproteobacteria bacterium]
MNRKFMLLAVSTVLFAALGCASTSAGKGKDIEPSSASEPPSTDPVLDALRNPPSAPPAPSPAATPAAPHAGAAAKAPARDKGEFENRPLPTIPADPPPPPNADELGDDNWARDQRNTKLRDKDREKVKHSDPEDDNWGRD